MGYRDDILIRLGVDPSGLDRGLKNATSRVRNFARGIGFAFAVGGITAFARAAARLADEISTMAATIGTSTDFLQGWQSAMESGGIKAEVSAQALQRFSRRLGEAVNGTGELKEDLDKLGIKYVDASGKARKMEDVLYDYADAIKAAESQQEQLRLSFKGFDSSGASVVGVLRKGSDEVRRLVEGANKMTEEQITRLAEAEATLARWQRNAIIYGVEGAEGTARVLSSGPAGDLARFFGALKAGAGFREAVDIAAGFNKVEKAAKKATETVEEFKEVKEMAYEASNEEEVAIYKLIEAEKERLGLAKETLGAKRASAQQDRATAFKDMSSFTLEELANVPGWLSGKAFQQRAMAQRSLFLQSEAKRARLWGEDEIAEDLTQRSLDIRKNIGALSGSEQNPFSRMDKSLAAMQEDMAALRTQAEGLGLKIDWRNTQ